MKPQILRPIAGFAALPSNWQVALIELEREGLGTLTPNGFLTDKEAKARLWETSAAYRFSDTRFDFRGEVMWSIDYLLTRTHRVPRKRTGTIYSYSLKHCLERERETARKQGATHAQTYICNGAAILAAKLCGLKIKRPLLRGIDPNATISIGNVDPIDARNWDGYSGCRERGKR